MTVEIVKATVEDLKDNVTIYRDRAGKTETIDLTEPEGFPTLLDIITDAATFTVVPDQYSGLADAEVVRKNDRLLFSKLVVLCCVMK